MIDQQGKELGEYAFQHGGAPLKDFVGWVFRKSAGVPPNRVAVAVEAPRGAVIDALLEAGVAVFAINPKQLDRFRDRFSVAGPKDDRRDALVLAHSLRTDMHHFHQLQPDEPRLIRMRELSRAEANTAVELRRESNQLWSYLQRYFPDLLALCPAADEPWLWDLLQRIQGLPQRLARLRPATLQQFCARHHLRRISPELLQKAGARSEEHTSELQ